MAVYCGDPQTAYHAGMVLGLFWLMLPGRSWRGFGLLAAAGLAGGLLSLVQIALAAEFGAESSRAMDVVPVSIWDVPSFLLRPADARENVRWHDVFMGMPPAGFDHYNSMYAFPLQPHRLAEFFWPGMSGDSGRRWPIEAGLASADWWVSSLYAGWLTAIACGLAIVHPNGNRKFCIWRAVFMVALLAALGSSGLVGMARWCWQVLSGQGFAFSYRAGDEVGGMYWLLATLLPGYSSFRYPVKWMTVVALAAGQITALTADGLGDRIRAQRFVRWTAAAAISQFVIVLGLLIAAGIRGSANVLPGEVTESGASNAFWFLLRGGVHGVVAAASLATAVCSMGARRHAGLPAIVALILAADLSLAGRPHILVTRWSTVADATSCLATMVEECRSEARRQPGPTRIHNVCSSYLVSDFRDSLDAEVRQQALRGLGYLPWLAGYAAVGDPGTMISRDMHVLCSSKVRDGRRIAPRRFLDAAGVEFFLITNMQAEMAASESLQRDWSPPQLAGVFTGDSPAGGNLPVVGIPFNDVDSEPPLLFVYRNETALPRARIVRDFATVSPVLPAERHNWLGLLERVAFPTTDVPDLRTAAILEVPGGETVLPQDRSATVPRVPERRERCDVVEDGSQLVAIEVDLTEPAVLYLADAFSRDWRARVISDGGPARPLATWRANRVHRAVGLPAGSHRVEFRYRSTAFTSTAPITVCAWLVAASGLALGCTAGRKP
jgi:hypothetical protein